MNASLMKKIADDQNQLNVVEAQELLNDLLLEVRNSALNGEYSLLHSFPDSDFCLVNHIKNELIDLEFEVELLEDDEAVDATYALNIDWSNVYYVDFDEDENEMEDEMEDEFEESSVIK